VLSCTKLRLQHFVLQCPCKEEEEEEGEGGGGGGEEEEEEEEEDAPTLYPAVFLQLN